MCPACLRGTMTAGPDAVRGSGPNHSHGTLMPMTQKRVVPIDGSTVSHHAIITLAIRLSHSTVASRSHCQAASGGYSKLRRSIVSSLGHDRPSDARHLVGNGNGDELGRLLGQQPHDPGMLLRMLPGISNNGCSTVNEQPSEITISLLGDAAEPLLSPRRMLPRHKSDPCRKIPTGFEVARICDSGGDRRSSDHADPGYGLEAAAHVIGTVMGMNGALQRPDLQFQSSDLIDNGLRRLLHRSWKSFTMTLVRDDLGKLRETFASSLRNQAKLGKVGSERIDQLRALTDQKIPRSMQHQQGLLIGRLDRHKPHRWACPGLTDGGGVGGIVFRPFDIALHIARRHQAHGVAEFGNFTCPMMSGCAGFHADQAGRNLAKQFNDLLPSQLSGDDDIANAIHAVHLEYVLGEINADGANLHVDDPPPVIRVQRSPFWHIRCRERASSTTSNSTVRLPSVGPQLTPR